MIPERYRLRNRWLVEKLSEEARPYVRYFCKKDGLYWYELRAERGDAVYSNIYEEPMFLNGAVVEIEATVKWFISGGEQNNENEFESSMEDSPNPPADNTAVEEYYEEVVDDPEADAKAKWWKPGGRTCWWWMSNEQDIQRYIQILKRYFKVRRYTKKLIRNTTEKWMTLTYLDDTGNRHYVDMSQRGHLEKIWEMLAFSIYEEPRWAEEERKIDFAKAVGEEKLIEIQRALFNAYCEDYRVILRHFGWDVQDNGETVTLNHKGLMHPVTSEKENWWPESHNLILQARDSETSGLARSFTLLLLEYNRIYRDFYIKGSPRLGCSLPALVYLEENKNKWC